MQGVIADVIIHDKFCQSVQGFGVLTPESLLYLYDWLVGLTTVSTAVLHCDWKHMFKSQLTGL